MIRLVLIDVDGTLVGKEGVPECVWEEVEALKALGVHLALTTGRPGRGAALAYAKRLAPQGLHIFESGAVVLSLAHGAPLLLEALPQEAAREITRFARQRGLPLEAYTASGGFYIEGDDPLLDLHQRLLDLSAEVRPLDEIEEPLVRLQILAGPGRWAEVRPLHPLADLHTATSPRMPGVLFASFTKKGTSKLSAAWFLASAYGLGLEEAAMVGDGENDLELLQAVGLGIAMGNAPERVKRVAKKVVGPVEACGLAEALAWLRGLN
ncbi:MAG: HAD family hydrolase [Thermaceae bacterium]